MTIEDRLRAAITARTSSVEPSPGAANRIEEKLMDAERSTARNRILLGVGSAAALVAIIVGVLAITDDGGETIDAADTTTTSAPTTTTSETTTTLAPPSNVDPAAPVFPDPSTSRRFESPEALAQSFATDLLGFRDPIVSEFAAGDSRSGEVEVRAFDAGNPTVVLVRQLEDDTWFVIGAVTESIRLDTPEQRATITSPQPLEGAAYAFEGTVSVLLYVDGVEEPVADTFVTGRGDGTLGDFSGELTFDVPATSDHGTLVLFEASAEDGSTIAATVIRVRF